MAGIKLAKICTVEFHLLLLEDMNASPTRSPIKNLIKKRDSLIKEFAKLPSSGSFKSVFLAVKLDDVQDALENAGWVGYRHKPTIKIPLDI